MATSNIMQNTLNLPQLTSDNFNNWKFRINILLEERQVHSVLETDITSLVTEEEKKEWCRNDAKARNVIVQCISDKHLDLIKDCKTAGEMMTVLEGIFQRKSTFAKLHLKRKLLSLKLNDYDKLEDHFLKFDSIIRELDGAGCKLEESDKVCHLLLTLSEKYGSVITAIETLNSDLTMEFVKSRLLDEELKLINKNKQSTNNREEVVFKATQITCFKCRKQGHKAVDCKSNSNYRGRYFRSYNRENERPPRTSQKRECANKANISFVALNCKTNFDDIHFIIDSGATEHLIKEEFRQYARKITKLEYKVRIQIANGEIMEAEEKAEFEGTCNGYKITLDALLISGMKHNLLSVGKLVSKGHKFVFSRDYVKLVGKTFEIKGKKMNNLYILDIDLCKSKIDNNILMNTSACNYIANSEIQSEIWHKRLGHLNRKSLMILGLPVSKDNCSKCIEGKATRLSFKPVIKKTKKIGELIYSDICGPIQQMTPEGHKYFQVIIDDFSHFCIVNLLREKREAAKNLIDYTKQINTQFGLKIKKIRVDNGGEFSSNFFQNFCKSKGIILEYTIPYNPQQNGVSERMNRTLLNKVRTKFADTNLPRYLWGEAIRASVYELNRSPTSALKGGIPAKIWYGANDLSKLRVFGCQAWMTIIPKQNKIESRAKAVRMIGYCGGGYRVWDPQENKIYISRDIIFDETKVNFENEIPVTQVENYIEEISDCNINENKEVEDIENECETIPNDRPKRNIQKPLKYEEYELYEAYCLFTETDPVNYKQAAKNKEWKNAIKEEIEAHEKFGTWFKVDLPIGKKAIDTKWIFKTKQNGIKKARLVARGFQEDSIQNVYAPVAKMSTVRMLLADALIKKMPIKQMDIPTAFLNGELENEIYIKAPEGVGQPDEVYKLKRALYGLKESPRCWNQRIDKFLQYNGYKRSCHDFCLYIKEDTSILIFVDDILLVGKDELIVKNLIKEFKAKDLGEIKQFLGMSINRTEKEIKITQTEMIENLLEKFGLKDCKGKSTPMEINFQVDINEETIIVPYRELIGSLLYISMISRPDILFATSFLSKFLDKPTNTLWKAGKRVLRYLKETKYLGLTFNDERKNEIIAYSDSDWATDKIDRKSVSGSVIFYHGCAVSWFSRKQQAVSLSSAEAEYIAAGETTSELLYIKGLAKDLNQNKDIDTFLLIDNQSAIHMISNYENSKRAKHIDIKAHFIKDVMQKELMKVKYVRSEENVADMFTKSLASCKYVNFRINLGIL